MTQANFTFISDAAGGDQFTVVSFSGHEAISTLYQYQVEIRAPLSIAIPLDDVLDSPARFITELEGKDYPVHGLLSNFEELQTAQDYVHYRAVLVPKLWTLSNYKTNEIYTQEKTVNAIIETVLENAGLISGTDFDLSGLAKNSLLSRDYICQFGESDFDFISRLMENEGIFYYFDHSSGDAEKIIFINNMNYEEISRSGLTFDVTPSTTKLHNCIDAWSCRKQRLAAGVTVRDFNPENPSLDISDTTDIDPMSRGTDYYYGENIQQPDEATYLSEIRAEQRLCNKTRYYGESSVTRLQAGYLFRMDMHPNDNYNGIEYLAVEVNHEGQHLDVMMNTGGSGEKKVQPQYRNSFVAIDASEQFRPARVTPKPRFYGTMTAFIYAESLTGRGVAEVDEQGRYRVHLPFDRADGSKDSTDPNRKASTWIRMAQPYIGKNEGMCFPLEGGTEVLLTFINGDPDQPIISAALPNASTPSLLNNETAHMASIVTPGAMVTKSYGGSYTNRSIPVVDSANQASASALDDFRNYGAIEGDGAGHYYGHFMPPADFTPALESEQFKFTRLNDFGQALHPDDYPDDGHSYLDEQISVTDEDSGKDTHIDRGTGPQYVHRVGSTFAYPQQERVYFCGTFHEDFHMDDMGIIGKKRLRDNEWRMTNEIDNKSDDDPQGAGPEVFHFPVPGGDGTQKKSDGTDFSPAQLETRFSPNRVRGVSEDKRWGDQMNFAYGRIFNWGGGAEMGTGNAGGEYNYGNGYSENLIIHNGGTAKSLGYIDSPFSKDEIEYDSINGWGPSSSDGMAGFIGIVAKGLGVANEGLEWLIDFPQEFIDSMDYGALQLLGLGPQTRIPIKIDQIIASYADQRKLFPDTTSVEKTYGGQYSYHLGFSVEIHQGHSVSKVYGDQEEMVEGDSETVVKGNSYESVVGTSNSFQLGTTSDIFVGAKNEMSLSASNNMCGGVAFDLFVGGKLETTLGVSTALMFGMDMGLQLSGLLKFTGGIGVDVTKGPIIEGNEAEVKAQKAKLEKIEAKLSNVNARVCKNTMSLVMGDLYLFI